MSSPPGWEEPLQEQRVFLLNHWAGSAAPQGLSLGFWSLFFVWWEAVYLEMSNTRAQLGPSTYQAQFCAYIPRRSHLSFSLHSPEFSTIRPHCVHGETNSQRKQVTLRVTYLNPGRLAQDMPYCLPCCSQGGCWCLLTCMWLTQWGSAGAQYESNLEENLHIVHLYGISRQKWFQLDAVAP